MRHSLRIGDISLIHVFCLVSVLSCLDTRAARAHEDGHPHPEPVAERVAHRPTALPDRIVLTWTSEPFSSQTVSWRTDTTVNHPIAQFAAADDGPRFVESAKTIKAVTQPLESDLGEAHYHTATFSGLQPKTKYVYRVGDSVNWSEWAHFVTASDKAEPFTFVYFGDAQNDVKSHWSRVVREAYSDSPKAAFMLHAGDLINQANRDAEWGDWFYASGFIHRMIPCVATPGNHEYPRPPTVRREGLAGGRPGRGNESPTGRGGNDLISRLDQNGDGVLSPDESKGRPVIQRLLPNADLSKPISVARLRRTMEQSRTASLQNRGRSGQSGGRPGGALPARRMASHWRPTFAFPENGPAGLEETVYYFDYQGTRFVSLNSNEKQQPQVEWLEYVLSDNPNRWTILTFHHPIYSSGTGRDNSEIRRLWQPVIDKYRVDLVLQGHDHTYARTKLMAYEENLPYGVSHQDKEAGTIYVVSVSGPKMYELDRKDFMKRAAENTQLYQIITVDGDELRYEARTAIGRPYDAFTLRKREGQVNELFDRVPETPERTSEPQSEPAAQ